MIDRSEFRSAVGNTFNDTYVEMTSVDDLLEVLEHFMREVVRRDAHATASEMLQLLVEENTH